MVVQLTFDFEVQLLRSLYQKNAKTMAIVLVEIDSVILKLSRFPQVQSEREWTLGPVHFWSPKSSSFSGSDSIVVEEAAKNF